MLINNDTPSASTLRKPVSDIGDHKHILWKRTNIADGIDEFKNTISSSSNNNNNVNNNVNNNDDFDDFENHCNMGCKI